MHAFFGGLPSRGLSAKWLAAIAFLLPFLFTLGLMCLRLTDKGMYSEVVKEDGVVEYATALTYLFGSGLACIIGISFLRQPRVSLDGWAHIMLCAGMFFVAGEEISWGQRLFGIESPVWFLENNAQNEITVHNVLSDRLVHSIYIAVASYGCLAYWLLPNFLRTRLAGRGAYVVPAPFLASFFLPAVIYYPIPFSVIFHPEGLTWHEQEPVELLLSLGFVTHLIVNRCRQLAFPEEVTNAPS